jgi:glutamate-1-semialdehyde 2,1-aminomutase
LRAPLPGYLEGLREQTRAAGALLIFDEVMTGFRVALGGAQQRYGVTPDLTCLGKVIGGGLPVGAYGGRAEIMDQIAPDGPVYQAGTLSGNPLAVAAGLTTVEILKQEDPYPGLEATTARLVEGLSRAAGAAGLPCFTTQVGSMFTAFFCEGPIHDFEGAKASDTERYGRYHRLMLDRGVYLAPSQFEAAFVSTAHGGEEIERTLAAATEALQAVRN